jgi:hypothetical protein
LHLGVERLGVVLGEDLGDELATSGDPTFSKTCLR